MSYDELADKLVLQSGVEKSTMMKSPCLRYKGDFVGMMFDKEDALIIKVSPDRVEELIADDKGMEFNFTKKKFKEWVLIPQEFEDDYEAYLHEAINYAKSKQKAK